jgi:hypothetical protein
MTDIREIDVGFFTQREQGEPNRPTVIEGKFPEFAGRSYNSPRPAPAHDAPPPDESPQNWRAENDRVDGKANRLLGQMTADALKQIDWLLVELHAHRQRLLSEAARVHQGLLDYTTLSQSTMQSTKIITESLMHWSRNRNAPGIAKEHHRASTGAFVQTGDASNLTAAQPETSAGTESAGGEAPAASNSPACPDPTGAETNEAAGAPSAGCS